MVERSEDDDKGRPTIGGAQQAARRSVVAIPTRAGGDSGSVAVIQRFGSGLQVNVHAHALVLDGVFTEAATVP